MPYTISWPNPTSVEVVYSGLTSDTEVQQAVTAIQEAAAFDTLRRVLHDFTQVLGCTHCDRTLLEIDASAVGPSLTNPNVKIAIVTERQDVIDMVRMYQGLRDTGYPMDIFPTVAAAKAWLAQPDWVAPRGAGRKRH